MFFNHFFTNIENNVDITEIMNNKTTTNEIVQK